MSGYGRAKLEAELRLEEMAAKAGIRFVSLRLPHVYGAHSLLFDQVRHGKVFFPGKGNNPFAHMHVIDAARALIHAAESGQPGLWVVADELSCTWNEYFRNAENLLSAPASDAHSTKIIVCGDTYFRRCVRVNRPGESVSQRGHIMLEFAFTGNSGNDASNDRFRA